MNKAKHPNKINMVQAFQKGPPDQPKDNPFIKAVRHFVWDRTIDDNTVEMDLAFSDEEIQQAADFMALDFNSIPPFVANISGRRPPMASWAIYGTCYHLMLERLQKIQRNEVTYNAGGVGAEYTSTQVKHMERMMDHHEKRFRAQVKDAKVNANINDAWDTFIG
jgi:hypothetical protein